MNDLDRFLGVSLAALLATGCALTSHAVQPSGLGAVRSGAELEAAIEQPGPLTVETVSSTEWAVDRGGLINLENPKAKAAGLTEGDEPIEVYFHAIRHPTKGLFIIDTGVEVAMRDRPDEAALMQSAVVKKYLHPEKMKFTAPLGEWLRSKGEPLAGVLFTHLHTDHLSGLRDVPKGTPLYNGPGEAHERALVNFFLSDVVDSAFEGQAPLSEWQFAADPSGQFAGVIDVFGDGSLWAISVPGHTAGSTAYVARTAQGPVLFTGDTCHTRWGWENGVEPGGFTADHARNLESLEKLRALAARHPAMQVRLGHQALAPSVSAAPAAAP